MATVATLGQSDPFSGNAAALYKAGNTDITSVSLLPGIQSVFRSIGTSCDYGILPIENMIDGHVVPVLELLLLGNRTIIDEITVPATYGCITGNPGSAVKTLFTTYKSVPECSEYISALPDVTLQQVSDIDAAVAGICTDANAAALIPSWAIDPSDYTVLDMNVSDYGSNSTRYIVLADQEQPFMPDRQYKTSIVLLEMIDKPGVLAGILSAFASRSINLSSIISRPTREHFGTYHFFIDCTGYVLSAEIQAALSDIKKLGHIKLLGSYPAAIAGDATQQAPSLPDHIPSMLSNQLRPDTRKPRITIAAGNGPYRNTLDGLANFNLAPVNGKKVLLKPNIGRVAEPYSGVVTNPQVVAAAIDAFRAAGAYVAIGESPITGVNLEEAYERSGISFIAHERACPLIDMDKRDPVEVAVRDGSVISSLKICADVFDFDFVVSIPVMKMHMHTVTTLSLKNMKGCLWRRSKVELHMLPRLPFAEDKSLNIAIADMASVLKPHLVIIDGTVGMEGLGPSSGEPKPLDMVIIGNDAIATDAVACTIMGLNPSQVPHLRIAAERGYGSLDPESYHVTNPDWHSLCQPFASVPQNIAMEFPRVRILDEQSCSACQSTVLLFMKRYGALLNDYFPDDKPIAIAIGKGHKGLPADTICVGNCTRRFRDTGVYVPGCPPVASSIVTALEKQIPNHPGKNHA